jgi:hypothetical protein
LFAKFDVVVDFSIVHNAVTGTGMRILKMHRLIACGGEIKDGQSPVSQQGCAGIILPESFSIGPPVGQRSGHSLQRIWTVFRPALYNARYAAHGVNILNNREYEGGYKKFKGFKVSP